MNIEVVKAFKDALINIGAVKTPVVSWKLLTSTSQNLQNCFSFNLKQTESTILPQEKNTIMNFGQSMYAIFSSSK